ncbi:hypothetical protein LTR36_002714 [Oleoguttula mirabilis]|uniref:FAD-binding domain-containing protein n=1 Tax=Oleoguttula mirabilis TaxID=1507867 RepID=A0AAV9JJZ4_9PEZI|nr:hypothetical protein LTR36_002714 [Oleoguttula mirabilis]
MPPLNILISGAGIAGSALAFWLSKLGHDVTVVERFPSLRATGLQVDLRGHGIEVMRRMGLEPAFRSKAAPERGLQVVDKSGKRRAYFPANKSGQGLQSFTSDFEIMRGDLCRLLHDAAKELGAKYVFGTAAESFTENGSAVEVRFTNGKMDRFDLWVGADGQGSHTRKMMRGPDTADAFYPLGDYVAYFTIPQPIQQGEEYIATMYMAPGGRGVMTRRHSPHAIQVYLGCKTYVEPLKSVRRGDIEGEKKALAAIYQGAGWRMEEILKAMVEGADNYYGERLGLVKLESWSHGRVALVGDAAYCPSAKTGMGTTAGLVGAYVLAGEIGRHCGQSDRGDASGKLDGEAASGLRAALEAYERKFQPFMHQVQKGIKADEEGDWDMMPSTPFAIAVMNWALGVVAFLRLNVLGEWLLRENVKGWDLPKYEEMLGSE